MPHIVQLLLFWLLKVVGVALVSGVLMWGVTKAKNEGLLGPPWIGIVFIGVIIVICILAVAVVMQMPGFA